MEGLGPFSEIKVVTAGVGPREINELLAQGWTLINVEFHEHVMELGTANQQRVVKMEMIGTLGRSTFQEGEDASRAREDASEQGESAIAAATINVPAGISLGDDAGSSPNEPPALDPPQPAPSRVRRVAKGEGEFIATGIRG